MHCRMNFQKSDSIGAFCKLTNSYALIAPGATEEYYDVLEGILAPKIPLVRTSIGECEVVGRLCAGNQHGLLVPNCVNELELINLEENLPENIKIGQVEERLSALGNIIACNDKIAIVHSDVDKETEEAIQDVLQVETFVNTIPYLETPGGYMVLNNNGGLVCPFVTNEEVEDLSAIFDIPFTKSTINGNSPLLGAGVAINDTIILYGMTSHSAEISPLLKLLNKSDYIYNRYQHKHSGRFWRSYWRADRAERRRIWAEEQAKEGI